MADVCCDINDEHDMNRNGGVAVVVCSDANVENDVNRNGGVSVDVDVQNDMNRSACTVRSMTRTETEM